METTADRRGALCPLADGTDVTRLDSLNVYAPARVAAVPLLQAADASVVWEPSTIRRRDRLQTVTVSAELVPGAAASEVMAGILPLAREASRSVWPPGYRYELGGQAGASAGTNQSISRHLPRSRVLIPPGARRPVQLRAASPRHPADDPARPDPGGRGASPSRTRTSGS